MLSQQRALLPVMALFVIFSVSYANMWEASDFKAPALTSASAYDRKVNFEKWLEAAGYEDEFTQINLSPDPDRDFVVVAKNTASVKIGQGLVISVPDSAVVTEQRVRAAFPEATKEISPSHCLVLYLMREVHNAKSKYQSWLDTLPRQFQSALWWDHEAVELVRGLAAIFVTQYRKDIKGDYEYFFKTMKIHEKFPDFVPAAAANWETFRWATSVVDTRAKFLNTPQITSQWDHTPVPKNLGIVPLVDMLQHNAHTNVTQVMYKPGRPVGTAIQPVPKDGKEIFYDHGEMNEAQLLAIRGRVAGLKLKGEKGPRMMPYKWDFVDMHIRVDEEKKRLAESLDLQRPTFHRLAKNQPPHKLILTMWVLEHEELPERPEEWRELELDVLERAGVKPQDAPSASHLVGQDEGQQRSIFDLCRELLEETLNEQYETMPVEREWKRIGRLIEDEVESHIIAIKYVNARERKILMSILKQVERRIEVLDKADPEKKEDL